MSHPVTAKRLALVCALASALLFVSALPAAFLWRYALPATVLGLGALGYQRHPRALHALSRTLDRWADGDRHKDAELLAKRHPLKSRTTTTL